MGQKKNKKGLCSPNPNVPFKRQNAHMLPTGGITNRHCARFAGPHPGEQGMGHRDCRALLQRKGENR
jgi:hypothetical protein